MFAPSEGEQRTRRTEENRAGAWGGVGAARRRCVRKQMETRWEEKRGTAEEWRERELCWQEKLSGVCQSAGLSIHLPCLHAPYEEEKGRLTELSRVSA